MMNFEKIQHRHEYIEKSIGTWKTIKGDSDLLVCNLECPITNSPNPVRKAGPTSKAGKELLDLFKHSGIDALSVANNHIFDYGEFGLNETIHYLKRVNIKAFGVQTYDNLHQSFIRVQAKGIRASIIAIAETEYNYIVERKINTDKFDLAKIGAQIQKERSESYIPIIYYHGGPEYWFLPSPKLSSIAKTLIQFGAGAVIINHSHAIGPQETYLNAPIVYGMGNLFTDSKLALKSNLSCISHVVHLTIDDQGKVAVSKTLGTKICKNCFFTFVLNDECQNHYISLMKDLEKVCLDSSLLNNFWSGFCAHNASRYAKQNILGIFLSYIWILLQQSKGVPAFLHKIYWNYLGSRGARLFRAMQTCENHQEVLAEVSDLVRSQRYIIFKDYADECLRNWNERVASIGSNTICPLCLHRNV